jgi:hypothetical protein
MRLLSTLIGFAAATLIASSALAADLPLARARIVIHVQHGDWGTARVEDIETVLTSVADSLLPYFPQHVSDRVSVTASEHGPRVLFEKSTDGAYRVLLNVRDTRWDQFAYQFSHELCHIFTNYEHREIGHGAVARDHQWFEETLCEAVSLFALDRMASSWEHAPPYPHWKDYAPAFREYGKRLLSENHRNLSPNKSIAEWYGENQAALASNPYLREKNELLATSLLPLLESTPGSLEAFGYLNRETFSSDRSFRAYLEAWYRCCPEESRDFVSLVIALFDRPDSKSRIMAIPTGAGTAVY